MRKFLFFLIIIILCFTFLSFASKGKKKRITLKGEKVVVTATKSDVDEKKIGSSITVITSDEIREKNYRTVEDALRGVPGITLTKMGSSSGVSSVMIRGTESSGTLVLINGIEVNDPMGPSRGFNFRDLLTDNIDRIEIIRGPQSTVWGSDALGGVINIILKNGKEKRVASLSSFYGSNNTYDFSISTRGKLGKILSYSLSLDRIDTDGFSQADERFGNSERDGYRNVTGTGNFVLKLNDNFSLNAFFYDIDSRSELDNHGGGFGDDPNYRGYLSFFMGKVGIDISQMSGKITHHALFSYYENRRNYKNPEDMDNSFSSFSRYYGDMKKGEWKTIFSINENNLLTAGYEYKREGGYSFYEYSSPYYSMYSPFPKASTTMNSFYIEDLLSPIENFYVVGGVRLDHHSEFGNDVNIKISPVYVINSTNTRLKMSFGTGFKAPSLYQLYAPETSFGPVGNPALKPENSWSLDGGFEQKFFKNRLDLSFTLFYNKFTDLIDFSFGSGYVNIGKANTKGAEFSGIFDVCKYFSVDGSYTYLDTENEITGEELLRRPHHTLNLNFNFRPVKNFKSTVNIFYKGNRWDMNYDVYPAERIKLDDYTLLNFVFNYTPRSGVDIFGRINNILDEDYEEVYGYGTDDTYFELGLRLNLK